MKYFNSLPLLTVTTPQGVSQVYRNIMERSSILPSILSNTSVFYKYDIQEGDTPEIVAFKYYGDSYRYWIVLYCNQILDPQWSWPLSYSQFSAYLADKYADSDINAVQSYQKIVTQQDLVSGTVTTNTVNITESDYNSLIPSNSIVNFPDGSSATISISKNALSFYDYELQQNEAKRTIQLLDVAYAAQLENQYVNIMGS